MALAALALAAASPSAHASGELDGLLVRVTADFARGNADCPAGRAASTATVATLVAASGGWRAETAPAVTVRRSPGGAFATADLSLGLVDAGGAPAGQVVLRAAHPDLGEACVLPGAPNGQVPVTLVGPVVIDAEGDAEDVAVGCGIAELSGGGQRVTATVLLRADVSACDGASAQLVGNGDLGATVTCAPTGWDAPPAVTWLRDGAAMESSAGASHVLTLTDAGHALQCVASGTRGGRALIRASTPVSVQRAADVATAAGIAVLGDSLSAGLGAGAEVGPCRRSPRSYLTNILQRLPADSPAVHLACAGAGVADLHAPARDGGASQLARLAAVAAHTRTVYLSLGAVDVGLDATVQHCLGRLRPVAACIDAAALLRREAELLALTGPRSLVSALVDVADAAPGSAIRVLDYPAPPDRPCAATGWLGEADLRTLRELVTERANAVVRRAVALGGALGLDVRLVEVEDVMRGHDACDAPSAVNGLWLHDGFPADVGAVFAPKASGHTLLGKREALGGRAPALRTVLSIDSRLARGGTQRDAIIVDGGPLVASVMRAPGVSLSLWRPDGTLETNALRLAVGPRDVAVVESPVAGTWIAELHADDSAALAAVPSTARQPALRLVVASAAGADLPPLAVAGVRASGRRVFADARASRAPGGGELRAIWDWGDGTPTSEGLTATHRYGRAGAYRVTLTVTDVTGRTDLTRAVVVAGRPARRPRPAVTVSALRPGTRLLTVRTTCPADAAYACHAAVDVRAPGRAGTTTAARSAEPGAPLVVTLPIDPALRPGLRSGAIRRLVVRVVVGDDSARAPIVLRPAPLKVRRPR